MGDCGFFRVNVKDCGMVGKKEGKENEKWGQHQSQWILMKDAALDKDPQSIILTRVCMRKPSRPSGLLPTAKSHSRFA